jgi:hypothetical protein
MPSPKHARRGDVLAAAKSGGWDHHQGLYDDTNVIVDTFTGDRGVIRVVWMRTPWSDTGRYSGASFSDRSTHTDRNIWSVDGRNSLLALLRTGSG